MHPVSIPVEPDAETARSWLEEELAKPEYRAGNNWLQDITDWIARLIERLLNVGGDGGALSAPTVLIIVALVFAIAGVVVYLVMGPLRRSRAARKSASVFDDDEREATDIRAAARDAAAREDWDTAVIERFRALVRSAEERHLVNVVPGMTAFEFTREAGVRVPSHATDLVACADAFDGVRYGHTRATAEVYGFVTRTDDSLTTATPQAAT